MANLSNMNSIFNFSKYIKMKSEEEKNKMKDEPIFHDHFPGHGCYIPVEKLSAYEVKCGKYRKILHGLITVHAGDIRALNTYKSYAALCAEKYRHFAFYPTAIHPYSKLRFVLEIIFSIAIFSSGIFLAAIYAKRDPRDSVYQMAAMAACDLVTIINIVTNFFTGYIVGKSDKFAVLNFKQIAYRYAKTWLVVDLLASISLILELLHVTDIMTNFVFDSVKLLRIPIMLIYVSNILNAVKASLYVKTGMEIFLLLTLYLAWNVYFQFNCQYVIEGTFTPTEPQNCSWISLAKLWNEDSHKRLIYSFDRAVAMLRKNTNMHLVGARHGVCVDNFYVVAWGIAKILVVHCSLKYIIASFGAESARAKYYNMNKQVEMYMKQRKFPPRIKDKILKSYAIRFQLNYFSEAHLLAWLTGQLHEDILMHTGRQLVRELEFLKQLPRPLLMQIAFKLKVVIYTAGDIIIKINKVGECMYFIGKGTVAVYSESGKEICHLEDGDFFGEIALVMKHHFRTASVVAVTNCELFRLDRKDFDSSIAYYPTVYEEIKNVATSRFETTSVLDDHHKTEIKISNEL